MDPSDNTSFGKIVSTDGSPPGRLDRLIAPMFRGFAMQHPCIGAKGVVMSGNFYFAVMGDMKSVESALNVIVCIERYLQVTDAVDDVMKTLALFFTDTFDSPKAFADQYWRFMQRVHDLDMMTNEWDATVSDDPKNPNFEMSLAGRAIFTTTLNPGHPRVARRFAYPTWVCNQKRQFDKLRAEGQFDKWQASIRKADADLDPTGVPNPLLADHGYASAAQQLAGWPVDPCPLVVRRTTTEKLAAAQSLIAASSTREMDPQVRDELSRRFALLEDSN